MGAFGTNFTRECIRPMGRQNRELEEKQVLPKGMISKGSWERKKLQTSTQKAK